MVGVGGPEEPQRASEMSHLSSKSRLRIVDMPLIDLTNK